MILIDSNVWIDIMERDPIWLDWSVAHLKLARSQGDIAINPVIHAEIAATFDSREQLDGFLRPVKVKNMAFSEEASFLAGQAFWADRRNKGARVGVLPDFFIGAQAQAEGWKILTRDAGRYTIYFPRVKLICP